MKCQSRTIILNDNSSQTKKKIIEVVLNKAIFSAVKYISAAVLKLK